MALLYATVKTSLIANLLLVQFTTIDLFVAGACVLLSLIFAIKAFFVDHKHKEKAVFALIIDALLISAGILLFYSIAFVWHLQRICIDPLYVTNFIFSAIYHNYLYINT